MDSNNLICSSLNLLLFFSFFFLAVAIEFRQAKDPSSTAAMGEYLYSSPPNISFRFIPLSQNPKTPQTNYSKQLCRQWGKWGMTEMRISECSWSVWASRYASIYQLMIWIVSYSFESDSGSGVVTPQNHRAPYWGMLFLQCLVDIVHFFLFRHWLTQIFP